MFGIDDAVAAVAPVLNGIIDRIWPDPTINAQMKTDLAKAQLDGTLKQFLANTDLIKAQIGVDQAEASSGNEYAADARPTVMYGMLAILMYQFVGAPFIGYVAALLGSHVPIPTIDFSAASDILLGLLGLGGMHTYENVKGPSK